MSNDTRIAVDVAKAVFEVAISDRPGHVRRDGAPAARAVPALPGPAAGGHGGHGGVRLGALLGAPDRAARPPRRAAAAAPRPALRPRQQDRPHRRQGHPGGQPQRRHPAGAGEDAWPSRCSTSLHRLRSGWVAERTARLNALRGLLRELGRLHPGGRARRWCPAVWALIEDADSRAARRAATHLRRGLPGDPRHRGAESSWSSGSWRRSRSSRRPSSACCTIPGIGLLTATALFAFVGDIRRFPSGRHLASYLGLTPREYSSGLKRHLGRISKRGDGYLRTLLIHGARSVLARTRSNASSRTACASGRTSSRRPTCHNKAAVARGQQAGADRLGGLERDHDSRYQPPRNASDRGRSKRNDLPPEGCQRKIA